MPDLRIHRDHALGLARATRTRLAALYGEQVPRPDADDTGRRLARKQAIMAGFRADYARLRSSWGLDPARSIPLDRWVAEANNASFGAQAAYDDLVPGFEALFAREGGDWRRFYDAVTQLSRMPRPERHRILQDLSHARPSHPS